MKSGSKFIAVFFSVLSVVVSSCLDSGDDIPDFNEQLQKDITAIDNYLEANNVANVVEHSSGLRYVVLEEAVDGVSATVENCVTAHYEGALMSNGQVFDDGESISFPLNRVIAGWQIGIPLLQEGDSAVLYIPSGYAYGHVGDKPAIPSNANLIFHVRVVKVGTTYKNTSNGTGSCE